MIFVARMYHNLHRETRAEHNSGGCREMSVGGIGNSVGASEMRDKTHRGEGPPR